MTHVRKFRAEVRAYTVNGAIGGMMADTQLDSMERAGMRRSFVFAIMPVSLIVGCSPVARIDVDVRSRADIAFDVTVDSKPSACIDSLLIRGADGVVRWEVTRAPDRRNCVQRITFPHLPQGYASPSTIGTLPGGSYAVEVEAGIHRGITRFAVR